MLRIVQTDKPHYYVVTTEAVPDGVWGPTHQPEMKEVIGFINDVATWCKVTFGNEYETWDIGPSGADFSFKDINHEMLFKLRWVK